MNDMNALKVRINKLQNKDAVTNAKLIRKLQRKVRALESANA
jgi:hypothetical protein